MSATCHQCGQPVPDTAPGGGLCSTCLWHMLHGAEETRTVTMPASDLPVVPGYIIVEEIARGGMGIVYRARQAEPEREVALKMLLPRESDREDLHERFRVEVRALAELDHPGILPLYQVGITGERPWFTMKLATGGSLAARLKRKRGACDPKWSARLIAAMAEAVHYAHAHGVLHRDIKPGNILFDERDSAFLADFGLAKLTDSALDMTHSHAVLGTLPYMPPEAAEKGAKSATVASDIYGLGAVLYELLSGRPPFVVEGMAALMKKIVEEEPERPSTLAHHVPRDLELVCLTCLAKDPRRRYATANDVADDLQRWLRGEPVAARRAGTIVRLCSWARRRPALAATSAALILTLTGGSVWLAVTKHQIVTTLADVREARGRADTQSDFLIGEFADELEKIGRIELMERAFATADANHRPLDDTGHLRRAKLLLRRASATWSKGDGESASGHLREAIRLTDDLLDRKVLEENATVTALEARCRLAEVIADTVSFDNGLAALDEAASKLNSGRILDLDESLHRQAEIDRTRAVIFTKLRGDKAAIEPANHAIDTIRTWRNRLAENPDRTLALIKALRTGGQALMGTNFDAARRNEALPLFREGCELAENLCSQPPVAAGAEFELAQCTGWIGAVLRRDGPSHATEALNCLQKDHEIMTRLSDRSPLNWMWRYKLADADLALAEYYDANGDAAAASRHREQRAAHLEVLVSQGPEVREWRLSRTLQLASDGKRFLKKKELDKAGKSFAAALSMSLEFARRHPASITDVTGWRDLTHSIAEQWKRIDSRESVRIYQEAARAAAAMADGNPEVAPLWRWTSAGLCRRLADLFPEFQGDATTALKANRDALELRAGLLRSRARHAVSEPGVVAGTFEKTELMQLEQNFPAEAIQTAGQALDLYIECRDIAGPPLPWAGPLKTVVEACARPEGPHTAAARALASRAAAGFFPPERRSSLTTEEQALAAALEALTGTPGVLP